MVLFDIILIRAHEQALKHGGPEGLEKFLLDMLLVWLVKTTIEMGC